MLTGKAREDFEKWLYENHNKEVILTTCSGDYEGGCFEYEETLYDVALYRDNIPYLLEGLIVKWLECCAKLNGFNSFENIFYRQYRNTGFKNRKEATEKAIEHANLIYNGENN